MRVAARRPVARDGSVWVCVCVARPGRGAEALQLVDGGPAPSLTATPENDATRTLHAGKQESERVGSDNSTLGSEGVRRGEG